MSTPTDPYNSGSRRPFDDDEEILAPIAPEESEDDAPEDAAAEATEDFPADSSFEPSSDGELAADAGAATANQEAAESSAQSPAPSAPMQPAAPAAEPAREFTAQPGASQEGTAPIWPARTAQPPHSGPTRTSVMGAVAQEEPPIVVERGANTAEQYAGAASSHSDQQDHAEGAEGASYQNAGDHGHWATDPGKLTEDVPELPASRTLAHIGGFFLTLLLLPVAWYLISDAGARLALVPDNPWVTESFKILPFLELLGGIVVAGIIWVIARSSSLGALVVGTLVAIAGLVAVVAPGLGNDVVGSLSNSIGDYNAFTGNVVHHLDLDLASGRIALFGFLLAATGYVSHAARKRGQVTATAITRREFLLADREN